jgi:6-pyruvoyl-tetrahydropterin synthase
MVLDFGEIKQWLVEDVEQVFDHKLILSIDDPLAEALLGPAKIYDARSSMWHGPWRMEFQGGDGIAIVLMKRTPTAENLARLISDLMEIRLELYDEHFVKCVRVWETPKSLAIWEA